MLLIVGLGNPGEQYKNTRHNAGFLILEKIPNLSWKEDKNYEAQISEASFSGQKIIFCKPLTYMNESGKAVAKIANFYKIMPENIIVVQDEMDLNFGELKLSQNKGANGHNGIKSIINHLNSPDFSRIKIGIGRPTTQQDEKNFVLENFSSEQNEKLEEISAKIHVIINDIVQYGINDAIKKYN
ncbi:MAG TPA: aminoacyl-tRNA hydrolase [Candidatus Pacearchaeota archaeon]|nr:aminoacyl-tRNA hydrolase [Candidatus Pacearchaeota archaeon]